MIRQDSFYCTENGLYIDMWDIQAIQFHTGYHNTGGPADIHMAHTGKVLTYNLTLEDIEHIMTWRNTQEF